MLRKLSLVAVAAAALGAAALAPTSASAFGPGWHGGVAWRLAPRLGLGSALLCRRSGLLWLWRLLCAPAGADPLGPPLAPGQSLLLIRAASNLKSPRPPQPGAFLLICMEPNVAFSGSNRRIRRKQFGPRRLGLAATSLNCKSTGTRHEQPHRQAERGDRSQDEPIDLRRRGRTAAKGTAAGDLAPLGASPASAR